MIRAKIEDDAVGVLIVGNFLDIAREFAALSDEISRKYPQVMDLATAIIKAECLEVEDDEKHS